MPVTATDSLLTNDIAIDTLAKDTVVLHPTVAFAGYEGIPLAKTIASEPIVPALLLFLFLFTAYTIVKGHKIIKETVKDFFYLRQRSSIFIDSLSGQSFLQNNFTVLFVGSVGLFLHIVFFNDANLIGNFDNPTLYLALFTGIALTAILLKVIIFKLLGYIFFDKNSTDIFIRGYFTALFTLGIVLFVVDIALIYTPAFLFLPILIISLIAVLVTFILIVYKTSQIFLNGIESLFYIILYLCSLEILPAFVMLEIIR